MMISSMSNGFNTIEHNHEILAEDVVDLKFISQSEFDGPFTVYHESDEVQIEGATRLDLSHNLVKRSLHIRQTSPDSLLGLHGPEHLLPGNKFRTAAGTTKVKMQETYMGLPVVGEGVVLEVDEDGRYTGELSGQLLEDIQDDVPSIHPTLSKSDALNIALIQNKQHNKEDILFDQDKDAELQIHVTGIEDVKACLVYRLNYRIETKHLTTRPTFIIDANNGNIIKSWDAISMSSWRKKHKRSVNDILKYRLVAGDGGNKKIGKHVYGLDLPELRVQTFGNGTCVLENQYGVIYNCDSSFKCSLEDQQPHQFDCDLGNNDTINDAYSPLNDALFYVGLTYEMFADWYEISDLLKTQDVNGGRCPVRVHYGESYENAFWDGKCITFGDGEDRFFPLTSLNVVAHEIGHGFTEVNSGLTYYGESGGLNEAFSDMAGEAAEEYLKHKIDWMVGFGIWKPENGSLRYFDDPPKDGKSISNAGDMCLKMDSHQSSGVYNKVFYILSNTPGWCVRKAFHIFVVANEIYWQPDTGFVDGACDILRVTKDLGYSQEDVKAAFRATGIEPCVPSSKNALGDLIAMKNDSTLLFDISSTHDGQLDYTHQVLFFTTVNRAIVTVSVTTPYFQYKINANPSSLEGPSRGFLPNLNLGRQCFKQNCSVSIYAPLEAKALIVPMAFFKTIVKGFDVTADISDLDEAYSNITENKKVVLNTEFTLPSVVIENKMTIFVLGTTSSGEGSYYIRHGDVPNIDSHEAEVVGSFSPRHGEGILAWMCAVKGGTYYMTIESFTANVTDLRIELAAWTIGTRAEVPVNTEARTTSISPEEWELPTFSWNH